MTPGDTATQPLREAIEILRAACTAAPRTLGDVRRNATLWLALKAGAAHSSFDFSNEVPPTETDRLHELPYLAAVGFAYAAGRLAPPVPQALAGALEAALKRSPSTAERSGFADEPIHAVGLLLLALALQDGTSATTLRASLSGPRGSSPTALLLQALADSSLSVRPVLLDEQRAVDLALSVLGGRADHATAAKLFPNIASTCGEKVLLELASLGKAPDTSDLDAMLVLAALETTVGDIWEEESSDWDESGDVAIVVALKEEFRELFDSIKDRCRTIQDGGRHYYLFDAPGPLGQPYRCVATFVGDMGTTQAGLVTEKTLQRWIPATVVMLGIAAGIHDDVRVGDIVVASQVDNYLDAAKAVGAGKFERAGNSYQVDHTLLDHVRNFEFVNAGPIARWRENAAARLQALDVDLPALLDADLVREAPAQLEAHIASGPVVAASADFIAWVRAGDRAYKALEMESGGLVISAHMSVTNVVALVIRAISDYGDDRKKDLDEIGRGALRRYAMRNAIELLWVLMAGGVLPKHAGSADTETRSLPAAGPRP